jgi:hypothetical protein
LFEYQVSIHIFLACSALILDVFQLAVTLYQPSFSKETENLFQFKIQETVFQFVETSLVVVVLLFTVVFTLLVVLVFDVPFLELK